MDESVIQHLERPQIASVLHAVADAIQRDGLSCGGSTDPFGRKCVIRHLVSETRSENELLNLCIERVNGYLLRNGETTLPMWSDSMGKQGRSDDVAHTLRALALLS